MTYSLSTPKRIHVIPTQRHARAHRPFLQILTVQHQCSIKVWVASSLLPCLVRPPINPVDPITSKPHPHTPVPSAPRNLPTIPLTGIHHPLIPHSQAKLAIYVQSAHAPSLGDETHQSGADVSDGVVFVQKTDVAFNSLLDGGLVLDLP